MFLDVGQFVTTITLDHTLFTGLAHPPQRPYTFSILNPEPTQPQTLPTQPPTFSSQLPSIPPQPPTTQRPIIQTTAQPIDPNNDRFGTGDFECGVRDYKPPTVTGLIVGGKNAHRGQFPWY